MKIAIVASFFAERNMNINTGHWPQRYSIIYIHLFSLGKQ